MVLGVLDLSAYLFVLVLIIVAFIRLAEAYKFVGSKSVPSDFVNLAKVFLLTLGFVILKLSLDYVYVLGYLESTGYGVLSFFVTLFVLAGIIYSAGLMYKFTRKIKK